MVYLITVKIDTVSVHLLHQYTVFRNENDKPIILIKHCNFLSSQSDKGTFYFSHQDLHSSIYFKTKVDSQTFFLTCFPSASTKTTNQSELEQTEKKRDSGTFTFL